MNGKEEEIYNILYKKKEINDKTPNLRTEDDKKKLKSLSYKISKFPKDLIDDIKTKFPFLQRKPKTAEQRKEQVIISYHIIKFSNIISNHIISYHIISYHIILGAGPRSRPLPLVSLITRLLLPPCTVTNALSYHKYFLTIGLKHRSDHWNILNKSTIRTLLISIRYEQD